MKKQVKNIKQKQDISFGVHDGQKRSAEKKALIAALALEHHRQRSPERLIKNELQAIRLRMEEYITSQNVTLEEIKTVKHFVTTFLETLKIKKTDFAKYIEIDISNLNKSFNNERPINYDLALKLGHFFHTAPDLWLKVEFKNTLLLFNGNKTRKEGYEKFNYEKMLQNT